MYRLLAFLLGWIAATTCFAQEVRKPMSELPKREVGDAAVSDNAQQHALRVRGMKAAIADIENRCHGSPIARTVKQSFSEHALRRGRWKMR
jgi:hypothetical protein